MTTLPPQFVPVSGLLSTLELLQVAVSGSLLLVRLNRPAKRNALNDTMIAQLRTVFTQLPEGISAAVISGAGSHFCSGLDLSELSEKSVFDGIHHSRMWHAALEDIQFGKVPVVAALHGAVVGGGLELAAAMHLRVADTGTYYGLPEGQRGIFVGGGASARVPRLIGFSRMTDMMLTGRVFDASEGLQYGLSNYVVPEGESEAKAIELAQRIASNAPLSNYAVTHALPRIAEMPQAAGLYVESLMAAIAQGDDEAKDRVRAFLEGRASKVVKS